MWHPAYPVAPAALLAGLRRGGGDPALRVQPDGVLWRATRTPDGAALLRLEVTGAEVLALAWGAGAGWVLDGVPDLLGARDDPAAFTPHPDHPRLVAAHRARPHWRVIRTRAVFEALAAAAIEQRVTGQEAYAAWRTLVHRFGDVAPGPGGDVRGEPGAAYAAGMRVPPAPRDWAAIPSWEWLRAGVDITRRRVVLAAAEVAAGLERTVEVDVREPDGAQRVAALLRTVPGAGVWTAAEVRQRAHGDPDAFSWNDFHVSRNVSWALAGEVLDDAGCAPLIECYRGHRFRVQRLLELDGAARPRVAPRITLPTHLPTRH